MIDNSIIEKMFEKYINRIPFTYDAMYNYNNSITNQSYELYFLKRKILFPTFYQYNLFFFIKKLR